LVKHITPPLLANECLLPDPERTVVSVRRWPLLQQPTAPPASAALQADVTSLSDLWASRSYIIEHMGGKSPDIIVCNSGLSERGYRFGRALPEIEGESRAERRVRVRQSFMDNLRESRLVMDTKIQGFVSWTHLWAGEAVYHKTPLQLVYVSSMQAIEPGIVH
jgi:hypothetical protein